MQWISTQDLINRFTQSKSVGFKEKMQANLMKNYLQKKLGIEAISFESGILYFKVNSAARREELYYQKDSIKEQFSKMAGGAAVKDISFVFPKAEE